jgi:hypothetical protein
MSGSGRRGSHTEEETDETDPGNPIPPAKEADVIFGHVRNALSLPDDTFVTDVAFSQIPDEDDFIRPQFEYDVLMDATGLGFFQRNNPVVRHVVLRRRETLEEEGLMPRIAVDVHPMTSCDIRMRASERGSMRCWKRTQSYATRATKSRCIRACTWRSALHFLNGYRATCRSVREP